MTHGKGRSWELRELLGRTPLVEIEWWSTIDFECAGERMVAGLCYNTDLMATQCKNRRALVLGRGASGEAAAEELRRRGYSVEFAENLALVVASPGEGQA